MRALLRQKRASPRALHTLNVLRHNAKMRSRVSHVLRGCLEEERAGFCRDAAWRQSST